MRRKLLSFNDYKHTAKDLARLQFDLQESLRPILFEISSIQQLHYEALRRLKPFNRVANNPKSIEKTITKLLTQLGLIDKETIVRNLSEKKSEPIKSSKENPLDLFQSWILGYDKVPSRQLQLLRPQVEEDLRKINELIKDYERQKVVKLKRDGPRDHQSKTILDFYYRCLNERQLILDYYLTGVYERAIEKSRVYLFPSMEILSFLKDFPYEFGTRWSSRSFDYRNIDCVSHRISVLGINVASKFIALYSSNKEKFYSSLFKKRSTGRIFQSIESNLKFIPLSKDRTAIFQELKRLFKAKRWMAFYSLALPQVEGLFTEMVLASNPDKNITSSLSIKVSAVRPEYHLSSSYFDYYEYVIPVQRNIFSHTGYGADFKLNAFDLLTDLEHIVRVFAELESPLVKISRLIKNRDPMDFSDAKGFVHYFDLLNSLPAKHTKEWEVRINSFQEEFLKEHCSLEMTISESTRKLKSVLKDLQVQTEYNFREYNLHQDFGNIPKSRIDELREDDRFCNKVSEFFLFQRDLVDELFVLRDFFQGLRKRVFKNKQDIIQFNVEVDFEIWDSNKRIAKKLTEIEGLVQT